MAVHLNQQDLTFILRQIKISEAHASGIPLTELRVGADGTILSDRSLYNVTTGVWLGDAAAPKAVPDPHVPYGLRTVDGTFNNIVPGRETWGASGQPMPQLLDPSFLNEQDGESFDTNGSAPGGVVTNNNYGVGGPVVDSDPRTISNLVVDASLNNPAAIAAALRIAGSETIVADQRAITAAYEAVQAAAPGDRDARQADLDTLLDQKGITVTNGSVDVLNVAPDEGLSKPFNAWMTFFGQFFDHGLDLISKGGNSTVYIPLAADDPLMTHGADGIAGNADDLVNFPQQQFMVLTRATPVEGSQRNVTTPFVDQNQTYTSNASHQVFLREYEMVDGKPVATGRLLGGADGGLATWADVKFQARTMLGIDLTDADVSAVPQLRVDAYGAFVRGPNGLPQVMTGLDANNQAIYVEGNLTTPINLTTIGAARTFNAFLDDIAHNAVPVLAGGVLVPDGDTDTGNVVGVNPQTGRNLAYDNELLDRHYITGDGRGNENIGLTTVHHIFHSEHNRQVEDQKLTILRDGDLAFVQQWLDAPITADNLAAIKAALAASTNQATFLASLEDGVAATGVPGIELNWNGERLFQAGRFATEMQYQHLVFEEFARKVQPLIDPFVFNSVTEINPAIFSEFANTVYRFGHSMLTENMPRLGADGQSLDTGLGLIESFLNPVLFDNDGTMSHDDGAAAIIRGMTIERGSEIDEFVVGALRNNLLGLPLDLPALNIARGRETGSPTLNEAREQLFAATGSTFLTPYTSWVEMAANLKNTMSVVNFIAAYGTHDTITGATTLEGKRDAAMALVFGGEGAPTDRLDYLNSRGSWAGTETGFNAVDLWIGGLAEKQMPFGGLLGSTFNAVFEAQMENLQDADRFYYLTRTQGQNFLVELEQNSFSKLMLANTSLSEAGVDGLRGTGDDIVSRHIGIDSFSEYDFELEVNAANQSDQNGSELGIDPTGNDPVMEAMGLAKVMRDDPGTSVDEGASGFLPSVNALVRRFDASGGLTGQLIDGTEDGGPAGPVTVSDLRANAARVGIVLRDADLADAPVLRLDTNGNLAYTPDPVVTTVVAVTNGSFDALTLVEGEPGVQSHPLGLHNGISPEGWSVSGGGIYTPPDFINDTDARDGANVVWLTGGATLSQLGGTTLQTGAQYQYSFQVGDRTDQAWPGGVARLVAVNGQTTTVLNTLTLQEPADGQWRSITIGTDRIPAHLAGAELRLEVTNLLPGISQILVDKVELVRTTGVSYRSDLTPAETAGYSAASDPFLRDAAGNVLHTGQAIVKPVPANGVDTLVIDPAELNQSYSTGHYLRFTGGEHALVGGTNGNDTIITDFGDDGIWGDAGDDRIESGAGVDLVNGGDGDDIITDSGDTGDFLKGEGGNDVIANSNGIDILMGGTGKDVIFAGVDSTEVFSGAGDDFVLGGDDFDLLMGNEGDDWLEGGGGFDTTAGDNSELFFNSAIKGHDVMFAGGDEHDFDGESGDDIMVQGESVMRNEGMFGFDWAIHKGNSLAADSDLTKPIFTTDAADVLRDRFDTVEALSGWNEHDVLRGDNRAAPDPAVPDPLAGLGAAEGTMVNHELTHGGVDRIDGLRTLLGDAGALQGGTGGFEGGIAFNAGNILLGGGGSDTMEGRGGDDVIDGDAWLNVRISIREEGSPDEIATIDSLKHTFSASDGNDVPGEWIGKSLSELMIARVITPLQLNIVREIVTANNVDDPATPLVNEADIDTAVFGNNFAEYDIVRGVDGTATVTHTRFDTGTSLTQFSDGTDHLKNIELVKFADRTIALRPIAATGQPVIRDATPTEGQALTVDTSSIADLNGLGTFSYQWQQSFNNGPFTAIAGATGPTFTPDNNPGTSFGDQAGARLRVVVSFTDGGGATETLTSAPTAPVGVDWADLLNANTFNGTAGDDIANGSLLFADTLSGNDGGDILNGLGGADVLNGGNGADTLTGGTGNDTVNGGADNDAIIWNANAIFATDGRDFVDGGAGTDTFDVNTRNGTNETFRVYTVAAALAGPNAIVGLTAAGLRPTTEIIITRTTGGAVNVASIIAELDNVEEIRIGNQTTDPVNGSAGAGDTVAIFGDFTGTSLALSTITIDGTAGDDSVDISSLTSAHRIVFRSNGGNDIIVGTLRGQDTIELPAGATLADYDATMNANGTTTLSNGTHSITYASVGTPTLGEHTVNPDDDGGGSTDGGDGGEVPRGAFGMTQRDLDGLEKLVRSEQPFADSDDNQGALGPRSVSGQGNNQDNPGSGQADTPFIRLTEARYGEADTATNNRDPNPIYDGLDPRAISNILGAQEAGLPKADNEANIFFMAFGQYVDHGLDFLPKSALNGTVQIGAPGTGHPGQGNPSDLTRAEVYATEDGVPQHLNKTSAYVDQNQAYGSHNLVTQFLREGDGNGGLTSHLLKGAPDPSNPSFNLLPTLREAIQHHWDNNTIFHDPSLPDGQIAFRTYYSNFPVSEGVTGDVIDATGGFDPLVYAKLASNFMGSGQALLLDSNPFISALDHYVAGDGRTNENFALTSMHTIWARNHNFHADQLEAAGFEGTPEELFQAAKILNEAEYQRVVFDEYADTLLGGLRAKDGSGNSHGHDGYNEEADAGVSHEFAAAAFRFGHSLIGQTLTVMDENGQPKQVSLVDAFLNPTNATGAFAAPLPPGYVPQPGYAEYGVGAILSGVATQPAEAVDFNIVDAVRNDLVRIQADLFAFNLARGRDVGLGTMNQIRNDLAASTNSYVEEAVGFAGDMSAYTSWEDFQTRNGLSDAVIAQFKEAYPDLVLDTADKLAAFTAANPDIELVNGNTVKGIDRVDFWLGGLAEQHINGGMVGQTFWVVLHEQFDRLQESDRFYYKDRLEAFDFYDAFIDGQEFSDIVARNTGLTDLDEHIFEVNDGEDANDDTGTGDGDDEEDQDTTGNGDGNEEDTDTGNGDDEDDETDTTGGGDDNEDEDEEEDEDGNTTGGGTTNPPSETTSHLVAGTANADVLSGTAGADTILGLGSDDNILSGDGADVVRAGDGNDFVEAGGGRDVIFGGAGDDDILAGSGDDMVYGDAGADRLLAGAGNDLINGGSGNDDVMGGDGNDLFVAEVGDGDDSYWGDEIGGGGGSDTLDMSAITANITANLGPIHSGRGTAVSAQSGTDSLWGIENMVTGSGEDVITAGDAVNVMDGGLGADTYRFETAAAAHGDTIMSFQPGDRIDLAGIDANQGMAGNQAFTLATGAAFDGVGQLLVTQEHRADGDYTVIEGNTGGDAMPEFRLSLKGAPAATAADFAL